MFDAELYMIGEALEIALKNGQAENKASRQLSRLRWKRVYVWADS